MSSIASTTGRAAANAASRRRTTKKISSGEAGVPASSAATPLAIRARSGVVARQRRLDRRAQGVAARAVVDAKQPAQRLGERREGGAAGRVAVRHQDGRRVAEAARELVDQARLAQTGRSEDHGQARGARRDGAVVDRRDAPQLVLAPDERDRRRARRSLERHHAVRRHRFAPPLQAEASERRERHELGDEAPRRFPDHHAAVARLLLEPGRDVDRIADDLGSRRSRRPRRC